jgi:hypothetical protein
VRATKSRSETELEPLALKISENAILMQTLREAVGSENLDLAGEVRRQITEYARTLDPSINTAEGTRIVVVLLKMIGHF